MRSATSSFLSLNGSVGTPTVFDAEQDHTKRKAKALRLKLIKRLPGGVLWMLYAVARDLARTVAILLKTLRLRRRHTHNPTKDRAIAVSVPCELLAVYSKNTQGSAGSREKE